MHGRPHLRMALARVLLAVAVLLACHPVLVRAQTITVYPVPSGDAPQAITAGPDGALWFTEEGCNNCSPNSPGLIGRITTAGAITLYPVPSGNALLYSIAPGPDGALWYTDYYGALIGRITTGGSFSQFSLSQGYGLPQGITAGSDGALWFTGISAIGQITTGGTLTRYSSYHTGIAIQPSIVSGPDDALWFPSYEAVESQGNQFYYNTINRITTSGSSSGFSISGKKARSIPGAIAAGPDGALWFTTSNSINRITTAGTITNSFPVDAATGHFPTASGGITSGPDGALWFVSRTNIGRITTAGAVSYFPVGSNAMPQSIVAGPDGAMWFTDRGTNAIGRITIPSTSNTLTVSELGTGTGQVTSDPSGINCSATSNQCSASFLSGSLVTLTASASAGSAFSGWSGGGCGGTGTCTVTMNAATTATASFAQLPSYMLSVAPAGNGSGTVTSSPSGIKLRRDVQRQLSHWHPGHAERRCRVRLDFRRLVGRRLQRH
jgi:virginiamycin B lyase